jgi:ABC-type branched-subunit amino acid transport system ATPase component
MSAPPLLELTAVHKRFGGLHAVNDVSFGVPAGSIKALIGPNGAGKTTLFNLIAGNLPVSAGTIRFQGREIHGCKPHRIARLGMARTFQNIKLFHGMTALECVMVGRHVQSRAGFFSARWSCSTCSASPTAPTSRPPAWPSASSGRWRWPGPWPRNRNCSCSTSRPPA